MNGKSTGIASAVTKPTLAIFDMNITRLSPAGSCVLTEIEGLYQDYEITVFADSFENPCPHRIRWVRVPLPKGPVFLRYVFFHLLAPVLYLFHFRFGKRPDLIQATQGQFIWCDVSYAHFCHEAYLTNQWEHSSVTGLRRLMRLATHRLNAAMERRAFALARKVVVPSQGLAREIKETYSGIGEKLHPLANPVDLVRFARPPSFDRNAMRARLGLRGDEVVLIFVALGDFDRKGLGVLLKAMAISKVAATLLVVGGSNGEVARFSAKAEAFGVAGQVRFVGLQKDVCPYFWVADIFTFPSIYEIFPLVAIQAAGAGIPVMATSGLYGVEEFIVDGLSGWLIKRDAGMWASALSRAVESRHALTQMGKAAREAAQPYGREVFQGRWKAVFELIDTTAA